MNTILFIIDNFGFLLLLSAIGFYYGSRRERMLTLPFFCIFMLAFFFRFTWYGNIDQKLVFLGGLFFVMWAAKGFTVLIKKSITYKILAIILFVLSTFSGVIDIMVIKNDFMYPVGDIGSINVMRWIKEKTKTDAVFLSYPDIFDPITLAGRRNYWGFYKNFGTPDRSVFVKDLFEATDPKIFVKAKEEGIDYLVIPKFEKIDFQYRIDGTALRTLLPVVYEDERFTVYRVASSKFVK
jgi:hypothetical protein